MHESHAIEEHFYWLESRYIREKTVWTIEMDADKNNNYATFALMMASD